MKKKDYEKAVELLKDIVQDCEFKEKIYLVGGCVRDLVLGKTPKDIDLCIDYQDGTDLFIDFLRTKPECSGFVTYNRFKTGKFSLDIGTDEKIDIECVVPRIETYNQGPRKPDTVQQTNITEDAKRRDFCCNALYKNLLTGEILDPTGRGLDDCRERILRTPLDPKQTFTDDPLRMLRAIRFACTKMFTISGETYSEIDNIPEYSALSTERIRDEFTKILMSKNAVWGIRVLIERCLMWRISKTFQFNVGFVQNNKHHDKTWAEHSYAVLDHVIRGGAGLELRLAALFHDVSKPTCYQIKEDGSFSFHGHDKKSAEETRETLTNLKYPGEVIDKVAFLVENHMCIKQLYDYSRQIYTGKPKKTRQLIRLLGDNMYDEMKLVEADNMNHRPCWNMPGQTESFLGEVERIKNLQPTKDFTVPITGECIMTDLRLGPGKIVGEIKQILQDYYDEDPENLSTPADLLRKYKEEFGGEALWFVKEGEKYLCFSVEPKKNEYGYWSTTEYEDLEIDPSEVVVTDISTAATGHFIYLPAVLCPRVWRKKARQLRAREIMKEVMDKVFELPQEFREDFKSLELRLDNAPDVYARVKWNDNTIEEWM